MSPEKAGIKGMGIMSPRINPREVVEAGLARWRQLYPASAARFSVPHEFIAALETVIMDAVLGPIEPAAPARTLAQRVEAIEGALLTMLDMERCGGLTSAMRMALIASLSPQPGQK